MSLEATAEKYTLEFDSVVVGDFVDFYLSTPVRAEQITRQQSLWNPTVLLDGRFPAFSWMHEFTIYIESATREQFISDYYDLQDKIVADSKVLVLKSSDQVENLIGYGSCYLSDYRLNKPSHLLLHAAGMVKFKFFGNVKPSVVIS